MCEVTTQTPAPAWQEIRPAHGLLRGLDLSEVWHYREVALVLAMRELKVRYKQTTLGAAWVVVQPLAAVVLYTLVFGRLAGLPSDGLPYPVFIYAGLILWTYFSASVEAATQSLVEHRELVTKVYFPRLLAPAAATLPRLIDLGISLVAFLVLSAAYDHHPGAAFALTPVWVLATVVLAFGAGLLFSALHVRYRDVGHALSLLLQLGMFAAPVVYASSSVDGPLRVLLSFNPLTGLLDGFRWSLTGASAPPALDLISLGSGLLVVIAGLVYFQQTERRFADLI
jgi:ABC-type polysaccharide/polyol phosphate export permease